jgi:hypothetical protein
MILKNYCKTVAKITAMRCTEFWSLDQNPRVQTVVTTVHTPYTVHMNSKHYVELAQNETSPGAPSSHHSIAPAVIEPTRTQTDRVHVTLELYTRPSMTAQQQRTHCTRVPHAKTHGCTRALYLLHHYRLEKIRDVGSTQISDLESEFYVLVFLDLTI